MNVQAPRVQAAEKRPLPVPHLRAVEFIRRMPGGSQPSLWRCEDGGTYVVKFQNNPQHIRVLANEMLAGRLARLIALPVADPAFVEVPPALADGAAQPWIRAEWRPLNVVPGVHYGSRSPGSLPETRLVDFLPDRLLRRVTNLSAAFLGALLFDKWTCNCDGRQAVFYQDAGQNHYTACLIDHGFCFNDGDWSFPDSAIRGIYPRRLVYEEVRGLHSFEPYLSTIENLSAFELEQCVQDIPASWCGEEPEKLYDLAQALYERRRKLRQALIDIKNSDQRPFPNWK